MIEAAREADDPRLLPIFEDVWPSVEMFFRLGTQWNITGMGSYIGLNYTSVDSLIRLYNVENKVSMFEDLQIMEKAALEILNKKGSNG